MKNGKTMTGGYSSDILGFSHKIVYSSRHQFNARAVETEIQRLLMRFPVCTVRLWRGPDHGAKYDEAIGEHKVGIYFTEKTFDEVKHLIKVNY